MVHSIGTNRRRGVAWQRKADRIGLRPDAPRLPTCPARPRGLRCIGIDL